MSRYEELKAEAQEPPSLPGNEFPVMSKFIAGRCAPDDRFGPVLLTAPLLLGRVARLRRLRQVPGGSDGGHRSLHVTRAE